MSPHPITFTKQHPGAVLVTFLAGMVFGPWALSGIQRVSGVGLSLPTYGGNGG